MSTFLTRSTVIAEATAELYNAGSSGAKPFTKELGQITAIVAAAGQDVAVAHWCEQRDIAWQWQLEYNEQRGHESLNHLTPVEYRSRYEASRGRGFISRCSNLGKACNVMKTFDANCVFCSYSDLEFIPKNVLHSVSLISPYFKEVNLVTNKRYLSNLNDLPSNVNLFLTENRGYDFGMYHRCIQNANLQGKTFIMNDSVFCFLIHRLF